jgi:PhoPQ-activated pathogenicity-related protein
MPKFIINAANDPYWTLDALNLYWNDLPEPKSVYYAPNASHSMEGAYEGVFSTIGAWFRLVAANKPIPKIEMETPVGKTLIVNAPGANAVLFWHATSDSKDFRNSHWDAQFALLDSEGKEVQYPLLPPAGKFLAVTAQAEYATGGGMSLRLNTPVVIRPAK